MKKKVLPVAANFSLNKKAKNKPANKKSRLN